MRFCFCSLMLLCLAFGCNVGRSGSSRDGGDTSVDTVRYADGYTVTRYGEYVKVEALDPWNKGKLLQRYILVPRDKPTPAGLPEGTVVRVPIRNAVVYTSVHCEMLESIGAMDAIAGVCESKYIINAEIKKRIGEGKIQDLGESTSPNIEKMISLGTEVIIASPFDHGSYGAVEKTGIPVIECADYMETEPLGSAEWIKFIGLFTGQSGSADSVFNETEANYNRIKSLVENVEYRPKLMTGIKYGSAWYVPSGGSFMARIYEDAGANYLFGYLAGRGGAPLSFETVLDKAIHADVWLIQYNWGNDMTYESLRADYSPYGKFDAFRDRHIYGCNSNYSRYHEEYPLHPDYLLAELISIFHPRLLPGYKLRYFKPLTD
ncbi:MAG: ABC transporter substrate-binding protein [Tannerella sp.]|jgi:iron complex transport system substrate-binding protein|nr:ABC transporter substrate-binding protein [Tannerella sp.]